MNIVGLWKKVALGAPVPKVNECYGDLSTIEEHGGQPPYCPLSEQKWQVSPVN
jgi:hypothetical protein